MKYPLKIESARLLAIHLIFGAGLLLVAGHAYAEKTGNGGVGVVCRDGSGKITQAQMLDTFEGTNLYGLSFEGKGLNLDAQIEAAQTRMLSNPDFLSGFKDEMSRVKLNILFLPKSVGLEPTNDAFPVIHQVGCKFEQVANYRDEDNRLYVDQNIFSAMDDANQAVLYVHEAVYALARKKVAETSSIRSRKLTAYLMGNVLDSDTIEATMKQLLRPPVLEVPGVKWSKAFNEISAASYWTEEPGLCGFQMIKDDHAGKLLMKWEGRKCGGRETQVEELNCDDHHCTAIVGRQIVRKHKTVVECQRHGQFESWIRLDLGYWNMFMKISPLTSDQIKYELGYIQSGVGVCTTTTAIFHR